MMLLSVLVVMVSGVSAFRQLEWNSLDSLPLKFIPHDNQPLTKKLDLCNGLGSPDYSVVYTNKTGNYEVRQYPESHWVTTYSTGIEYDKASRSNFRKLFNYIDGKNVKDEKVTMTCPVIVLVTPGPGPTCTSNFSMSFFVDPAAKAPPASGDKNIQFTTIPAVKVYVRDFPGFANYEKYREEGLSLMSAIGDTSLYHTEFYYTAGYDSPFKLFNRHNEVWFVAK
ncbi:heme-binding protein 2-like [Mizuhopecten yessoensis]|uniref:Heme-binding protein 1 n=1 Tax=Mizuhopecten yessoensis TaxID=6573 RepID=A0A210Q959_MIZYE|nr:heme-binding protein 2-like [Mizuhopecten yessoensis]OWF45245.1 Heme-binding protein 2 [Mizuhopecten yessoensis]